MSDIVLVHGAWHGGWCWEKLRPVLEAGGDRVWTPTLTGLGDRADEAGPDVGVETHVGDLIRVLEDAGLVEAVLVAHSYAGIPATVVADRCPERLAAVIYLDSGMPQDGQSANDVFPGSDDLFRAAPTDGGTPDAADWLIPVPIDETFGITSTSDLSWLRANLTAQPLLTFEEPVRLRSRPPNVPSGAIICTLDGTADSAASRSFGAIPTIWIEAGHDAMVTDPMLVATSIRDVLQRIEARVKTSPTAKPKPQ